MSKNTKQRVVYFRLDDKLAQKLDRRIARAGYPSRSQFFTAVSYATLYGLEPAKQPLDADEIENIANLPETVISWVRETMPRMSEEEILSGLHEVIEEMLTPVIAMKGVDIAFDATWEDVRAAFHEKSGVWVTESDLREAYASFAAVHRTKLERYREKQLRGDDLEE